MTPDDKIKRIQTLMAQNGIHACVIPSNDPHQSEYVADHWQARRWLTGFTGSAGTAVITREKALLWTDSRYFIQARSQLAGSEFVLMKMGEKEVPEFSKWLGKHLNEKDIIGIDGLLFSMESVKKLKKELDRRKIVLNTDTDVISPLWDDRPAMPCSKAWDFPARYAGRSRKEKLDRIRETLTETGADFHIMASLDDIAWTFNLRGNDIHNSPVNIAFAAIDPENAHLFIIKSKLDPDLYATLEKDSIQIHEYRRFYEYLAHIPPQTTLLLSEKTVNYRIYDAIPKSCRIINQPNPAMLLKSVKNDIEISHIRDTMIKDGVAMTRFLHWIETCHEKETLTEVSAGEKIFELRSHQADFMDNSFDPIMAFLDHSPICHYSANENTDCVIKSPGMFLTDSGGNYLTGTTDITRSLYLGVATSAIIRDYTLVLKGHIAVARAIFPEGTKGYQVDTLARQFMWRHGIHFGHGTGHGVGFFLNVHEGPASISPHPVDCELKSGMVLTNEPGIYRENQYGIRIENMILVKDDAKTGFGRFLSFENLTLCHYERELIDRTLLDEEEINWINTYHDTVRKTLSPLLEPDVTAWLQQKTRPV